MATWLPVPQRRILLENVSFVYAFGNTKWTSLFRDNGEAALKLLLLGFGDVRNVLATAADCVAQSTAKCRRLSFQCCNLSLLNVARGLLLLRLASTIDPSSQYDLDFFWGVSYCLRLTPAHAERLAAAVRSLLDSPGRVGSWVPDAGEAASVEAALRGWLQPQRSVAEVERERTAVQMARLSSKVQQTVDTVDEYRQLYSGQATAMLCTLLPCPATLMPAVQLPMRLPLARCPPCTPCTQLVSTQRQRSTLRMLPPDHGSDGLTTTTQLVEACTMVHLSDGALPLAALRIEPFSRLPPAALARGLQLLLSGAAAHSSDDGNAGGSNVSGPSSSAASDSTSSSGVSDTGLVLSDGLVLRRLAKHADRFELELAVEERLGGRLSSSGLSCELPGAPLGGGASHGLKLTLEQPASLRATITIPWPVDSSSAKISVRRSARTVAIQLAKHLHWPSDSVLLPKLDAAALPAWGTGKAARQELSYHLAFMFSHPERIAHSHGATLGSGGSDMYDVKESLHALFVRSFEGCTTHMLTSTAAADQSEPSLILVVHGGFKRLPDGRPLLHVSCVDQDAAKRAFPTEASRQAPFARFMRVIRRHGGGREQHANVNCTPPELRLLRYLLARNAAALRVPSWQSSLLELPSEWQASFLTPACSDYVAPHDEGAALMGELSEIAARERSKGAAAPSHAQPPHGLAGSSGRASQRAKPGIRSSSSAAAAATATTSRASSSTGRASGASSSGSGSGSSSNPAIQTAVQHKEAGNALFKQQRIVAAASRYAQGVVAMAQGAGGGALPQGEQRQLLVDLPNNSGLALIRQAEQDPSAARDCLANAADACSRALELDPSNSKARYKQGKLEAAQQDLASIPGSEDAAVEALRRQLATALQLPGQ